MVPAQLRKPKALANANFYDQIALSTQNKLVEINSAGCLYRQEYVFCDVEKFANEQPMMPTKTKRGKSCEGYRDAGAIYESSRVEALNRRLTTDSIAATRPEPSGIKPNPPRRPPPDSALRWAAKSAYAP